MTRVMSNKSPGGKSRVEKSDPQTLDGRSRLVCSLLLDCDALSPFGTSCLSETLRESGSTLLSDSCAQCYQIGMQMSGIKEGEAR